MRRILVSLILSIFIVASTPGSAQRVKILVDGQVRDVAAGDLIPAHMLEAAAISFSSNDRVLVNGISVPLDQPIQSAGAFVLQLRRAVPVVVIASNGQVAINTSAFTVGEALQEAGVASLGARDKVEPPDGTFVTSGMIINLTPARTMTITAGDKSVTVYASASTVGAAAAEAGIPLMGLDRSAPGESEAFPADGQIRIVRVSESTVSAYKGIPNETQLIVTTELEPPLQDVLVPGSIGLSFERTRIRYEDSAEVSRYVESATVIREPQTRVVRSSYWAAKQMYATSYSPCRSAADSCLNSTAYGLPVTRGVVAMNYDWYLTLRGMRVFIPGYGIAVIADNNGSCGFTDCRPWIDLGFSDSDYEEWSGWVTVYFLAPAPIEIPWMLR